MNDATCLLARGLLVGEAVSWPNASYRIRMLTPRRLARMETLAAFAREHATTTPAVPYAHSSPIQTLQPGAGEISEWFAQSVDAFTESQAGHTSLSDSWQLLADAEPRATRIGSRIALGNLRRGLPAPQSGNDNPHYFDDLPMVRAVAAAAVFSDERARRVAAAEDASFTGARDGVWCAEATAVLFSRLLDGSGAADAVAGAVECLPRQTWSRRLADSALEVAVDPAPPIALAHRLSTEIGDVIYSYATVAPETLAFLLAIVSTARSADEVLLAALAQPRNAATLPALAAAVAGVLFGVDWMPPALDLGTLLPGVSIARFAGRSIAEVVRGE